MSKNNKKGGLVAAKTENNNNGTSMQELEAAAAKTTHNQSSMDRNHQVDLLRIAHETFSTDPDAVKHTGFSAEVIEKLNHVKALGIATVLANEVAFGNSDFAVTMRKAALPELKEALAEIGATIDETKLLPTNVEDVVAIPSTEVKVSDDTKKALEDDKKANAAAAGKSYDPTKIKDENELKEALSYLLCTHKGEMIMDNLNKAINFWRAYMQIQAKNKVDSCEKTLKDTTDDKYKANAEKALAEAKADVEKLKTMSKQDVFQNIVNLTGRIGTLAAGLGNHIFMVTTASGSPVSAFCSLYDASIDKATKKAKYSNEELADMIKCLVTVEANRIRSNAQKTISDEQKLPKKDQVQAHIDTANKNIAYAEKAISCISNASSEFVSSLKEKYLAGDNFAKKTVVSIKRAFYSEVTADMMAKVKMDSLLDNATQYAGIISNLFRNPSDPIEGYDKSNIVDLAFKSDDEIKAEQEAADKAAKEAAEKKAAEDAKKAEKGKKKAQQKK